MNVNPIPKPLAGEGLLALQPAPAPIADAGWHRHLNLFTGRALTAPALIAEQVGRVGRLAASGQGVSAGVVSGLETLTFAAGDGRPILQISAGRGISQAGEDVVVPSAMHVAIDDLPVYGPVTLFGAAAPPTPGAEVARQFGPTLGQLRGRGITFLPVGVVLLQSVVAEMIGAAPRPSTCEGDSNIDAFDDWQIVDGCRLVFYTWPAEWATLPTDDGSATWRNLVVNSIFEAERQSDPSVGPPWLQVGLPVCVLALDSARQHPRFVDRYAVVRAGGRARARTPVVAGAGTPCLWQARIQQLAAQLAAPDVRAQTIRDLGHQYRFLPPVGLLPRQILVHTDSTWSSQFFPDGYVIEAVPIPQEQLDAVVRASAGLAPFDATVPDRVRVLVPVAQPWFDPHLLETATVDPVFQRTVDQAVGERSLVLQRRAVVRTWASTVTQALVGHPIAYPTPDPDELESNETVASGALEPTEESQIQPVTNPALGTVVQPTQPLADLTTWLQAHTPLSDAERGLLATNGLDQFIVTLEGKINQTNDAIDFGFVRVQTDIYRTRQLMLGNIEATRLATSPVLASIAQGSTALATRDAINEFLTAARPGFAFHAAAAAAPAAAHAAAAPDASPAAAGGAQLALVSAGNTFLSGDLVRAHAAHPSTSSSRVRIDLASGDSTSVSETIGTPTGLGVQAISTQALQAASHARLFESAAEAPIEDIQQQQPIVGAPVVFRGVTVAERLKAPPAVEAKTYTVATRAEVVGRLANLPINVDNIQVPGFIQNSVQTSIDFKTIRDGNFVNQIIAGTHDPNPAPPGGGADDEASFFAGGVRALENTVSTLRLIEGRVQAYQRALDVCRQTQQALNQLRFEIDARLKTLGDQLARTRHSVATARALLQDEQTRIHDLNTRRLSILQEHVTFVAYHRPRSTDLLTYSAGHAGVPVRGVDPGVSTTVVPACLAQDTAVPPQIQAMVDLLREAPVRWFPHRRVELDRFDQWDVLYSTLHAAKVRAQTRTIAQSQVIPVVHGAAGLLSNVLDTVITSQRQVVSQFRADTAQLDLGGLAIQSWRTTRDLAEDHLSLGDLMDIGHGRTDVVQSAATELHDIARVATCLFAAFRNVEPRIRLVWAERLSQYTAPVDLRNLASLPRWGEVHPVERQSMQGLTDWLYQRVDPSRSDATATLNDLIRVCILLASHAPVDSILAGHVPQPTLIQPGHRVHLTVDATGVGIGMHVLMYGGASGSDVVGHGVVEDLSPGSAAARVLALAGGATSVQLAQNARVKFVTPNGVSGLL